MKFTISLNNKLLNPWRILKQFKKIILMKTYLLMNPWRILKQFKKINLMITYLLMICQFHKKPKKSKFKR